MPVYCDTGIVMAAWFSSGLIYGLFQALTKPGIKAMGDEGALYCLARSYLSHGTSNAQDRGGYGFERYANDDQGHIPLMSREYLPVQTTCCWQE